MLLNWLARKFGFHKQVDFQTISIKVIPESEHRYDTMGDWWVGNDGTWHIRVSQLGDWRKEFAVIVHEMVEMALCTYRGVAEQDVMDFDLNFEANREEGNYEEPGDQKDAPYRKEHQFATKIEKQITKELGVKWGSY